MIFAQSAGLALAAAAAVAASPAPRTHPYVGPTEHAAPAVASQPVRFSVFLPLRDPAGLEALVAAQQDKASPSYHKWLSPQQFKVRFGPTEASLQRAAAALKAQGFTVEETGVRSIAVSGTADTVSRAFGARLVSIQPRTGPARLAAETPLRLPAALQAEGAFVAAFSGAPPLHVHSRIGRPATGGLKPANRYAANGPYWFTDLKQAYDYPSYQTQVNGQNLDGSGVRVAVLIDGDILDADVKNFLESERFAYVSRKRVDPTFAHVRVNGGASYNPAGDSGEGALDVQQVLSGAPGASVALINIRSLSDGDVADGYQFIVDHNTYDIVTSSFGGCESENSSSYLDNEHATFLQGAAQGITFLASSGDSGAPACSNASLGVEWPAVDPLVTGVGGGNLITSVISGSRRSTYVRETADADPEGGGAYWAAGGGISTHFARPAYQKLVRTGSTMRTVPDVGMFVGGLAGINQCVSTCSPDGSSVVLALGTNDVYANDTTGYYDAIGTSVASPEFAGAVALFVQSAGRQGSLNPYLYAAAAAQTKGTGPRVFRHPTQGFDGYYDINQPGIRYNYIYGNGSPLVKELFGYGSAAPAGTPQTPSNP